MPAFFIYLFSWLLIVFHLVFYYWIIKIFVMKQNIINERKNEQRQMKRKSRDQIIFSCVFFCSPIYYYLASSVSSYVLSLYGIMWLALARRKCLSCYQTMLYCFSLLHSYHLLYPVSLINMGIFCLYINLVAVRCFCLLISSITNASC